MTEQEFIQNETAKQQTKIRNLLRKIQKTGFAGNKTIELFLINHPSLNSVYLRRIPYNHYRLTGRKEKQMFPNIGKLKTLIKDLPDTMPISLTAVNDGECKVDTEVKNLPCEYDGITNRYIYKDVFSITLHVDY